MVRYKLFIPVFRSPHPPEFTARGVANGVFWGMTPFMGLQTIAIVITWVVLRRLHKESSFLQAMIWAWVNNPVTMIPMYYVFFVAGAWLTGASHGISGYDTFVAVWDASRAEATWLASALYIARTVGLAVGVGCLPFAALGSWIAYRWALRITRARKRRIAARRALYVDD